MVPKAARPWSAVSSPMRGSAFKKSLHTSEHDRPDVTSSPPVGTISGQDRPKRLVLIEEGWVKTKMTNTHGRCPRGRHLIAKVPSGHWKTLTFVAALRCDGIVAPYVRS